jgi:hypothetical protein
MERLIKALELLERAKTSNASFGVVFLRESDVDVLAWYVRERAMKQAYQLLGMRGAQ